jgi:hypothetical protein
VSAPTDSDFAELKRSVAAAIGDVNDVEHDASQWGGPAAPVVNAAGDAVSALEVLESALIEYEKSLP